MAERTIVQYGVYQFSPEEKRAYRLQVFAQVLTQPGNRYANERLPKERSFYGYAQLMNGDFVVRTVQLEYTNQCIFEFTQSDNLNTWLMSAHIRGVLISIGNLASALGFTSEVNPIDTLTYPLAYDRIVFRLFNNTTLLVFTRIVELPELEIAPNTVEDTGSGEPVDTSSTTATPNPYDPGYDVPTLPYDPSTDDNGETYDPPRPPVIQTGNFKCTVYWRSDYYGAGWSGSSENILMNPESQPYRQASGNSVKIAWRYGNNQEWAVINLSGASQGIVDSTQIISSATVPW